MVTRDASPNPGNPLEFCKKVHQETTTERGSGRFKSQGANLMGLEFLQDFVGAIVAAQVASTWDV